MSQKTNDAISRSDRVLVAAMAIILATASAAIGASLTYHPSTDKVAALKPAVKVVESPFGRNRSRRYRDDPAPGRAQMPVGSVVLRGPRRSACYGGQKAIAEVVFHRMNRGDYGHSICAVVYEGSNHSGCQFSFTCNGDMKRAKQPSAWRQAEALAAKILTGQVALKNATGGALNFHAVSVSPEWSDTMDRTTQIGNHVFYRGAPHTRAS